MLFHDTQDVNNFNLFSMVLHRTSEATTTTNPPSSVRHPACRLYPQTIQTISNYPCRQSRLHADASIIFQPPHLYISCLLTLSFFLILFFFLLYRSPHDASRNFSNPSKASSALRIRSLSNSNPKVRRCNCNSSVSINISRA